MPICIECREPVATLWTQYAAGGDSSSGHNIRLTVCQKCGQFCDKYVEHDFVVMFIDLVLIKPQVYRHLLYNALMHKEDRLDVCIFSLPLAHLNRAWSHILPLIYGCDVCHANSSSHPYTA
jgi:hypothetical protein